MHDWIITKRQLGIAFAAGGALAFIAILAVDILRGHGAIGTAQKFALVACVGLLIMGLTLIPLGDRPA